MSALPPFLPIEALAHYLRAEGLTRGEQLTLSPLSGGQSNPTFLLDSASHRYVLRTKPSGQLIASAHAIDREYRVMKALQDRAVPVPRMFGYCEDETIIGTPFYIMEFLEGRVLVDPSLPGMTPQERGEIYHEMNRVIATLHSVDYAAAGLSSFGRPGNYFARQIGRWSRQCQESTLPLNGAMQRLMEWLPDHIPAGDETTLVHGDYRLDNLLFHPTEPRVIGVLDWELSTLGHPLADFSYQCMSWTIPPALWRGVAEHWNFYLAYNLFRIAAILHGIAQRSVDGNAAAEDAMQTGLKAGPLAELGWQCALRHTGQRT